MPASRTARETAFDILMEVEEGGFAADLLATETAALESRDAGLAAALVLGVLRNRAALNHIFERIGHRDPERVDRPVRIAIQMGIYQLRWFERVPPHAAVNETVNLVKRARKKFAAGLVNAILRKVDREPVDYPSASVELSTPQWLLEGWTRQFGAEQARNIALASLETPAAYIRVPAGAVPPEGAEATTIPGCYRVHETALARGWRIQDIGSQSIVPLLDLAPGQTFLDLCAAPGNKTAQALEIPLHAVASDLRPVRLKRLKTLNIPLVALDGTRPLPFQAAFDRILVDAPCSGTGTLGHNPEIKWRLIYNDLGDFQLRQVRLLRRALDVLKPGGLLVYSTCSLEREENEDVLDQVCPHRVKQFVRRIPGRDPGDGFCAAVIS